MKTLLRSQAPTTLQAVFTLALAIAVATPACLPSYTAPADAGNAARDDAGEPLGMLAITSVEPKVGAVGASPRVTVRGTGFDLSVAVIFDNDRVCNNKELVSPTEITCTVPVNGVAGPVQVVVERSVDGDKKTLDNAFRYFYPNAMFSAPRWKILEPNNPKNPTLVLAMDMNQDKFPDVVIAKEEGADLGVFLLRPPTMPDGMIPTISGAYSVGGGTRTARDLTTASLLPNQNPSIIYSFNQEVKIYSPSGDGKSLGDFSSAGFSPTLLTSDCSRELGCRVAAVGLPAAAGSTGDGLVVSESAQLSLYYWIKNGAGSLERRGHHIQEYKNIGDRFSVLSITAADFTGDGKADVAITGSNDTVRLYQGIGGVPYFSFLAESVARPNTIASLSTDLDLDGRVDLVGLSQAMGNSLLPYFGGATNLQPSALVTGIGGKIALGFAAGDYNGDGYPDIGLVDGASGTEGKYILLAGSGVQVAGDPVFRAPTLSKLDNEHSSIAMADFNNDGLADLLIPDYDKDSVSIYVNTSGPKPRK